MIKEFEHKKAISLIKEIHTEGHSPLLVLADDFSTYYVKNTRGHNPAIQIINEFICHSLLNIWGIKNPEVAIIDVDKSILTFNLSDNHRSYYYENITFGSKVLENVVEMNEMVGVSKRIDFNRFNNPIDFLKIALFDIWVENDDRKPTNPNIILQSINSKLEVIAIDHAFTFSTMDYSELYREGITQSFNDNILFSSFVKQILSFIRKQDFTTDSLDEYFYICLEQSKRNFDVIAQYIPPSLGFSNELKDQLFSFLFNEDRNTKVLTEFKSRL
jgi:hypothetical protein